MSRLHHLYTRGVLWLLSVIAKEAAALIHDSGREDGMTELRDFMRRDLVAHHVAREAERMRSYHQGYRDAMRFYGDDSADEAPSERVMWMIHQLKDMVSGPGVQLGLPNGRWVRAVPLPFYGGLFDRCRDAWAVIRGDAYAVRWPEAGELEYALNGKVDG